MRISDWSSDVCSSDLLPFAQQFVVWSMRRWVAAMRPGSRVGRNHLVEAFQRLRMPEGYRSLHDVMTLIAVSAARKIEVRCCGRSEERRVGKGSGSPCRSRWSQYP